MAEQKLRHCLRDPRGEVAPPETVVTGNTLSMIVCFVAHCFISTSHLNFSFIEHSTCPASLAGAMEDPGMSEEWGGLEKPCTSDHLGAVQEKRMSDRQRKC